MGDLSLQERANARVVVLRHRLEANFENFLIFRVLVQNSISLVRFLLFRIEAGELCQFLATDPLPLGAIPLMLRHLLIECRDASFRELFELR